MYEPVKVTIHSNLIRFMSIERLRFLTFLLKVPRRLRRFQLALPNTWPHLHWRIFLSFRSFSNYSNFHNENRIVMRFFAIIDALTSSRDSPSLFAPLSIAVSFATLTMRGFHARSIPAVVLILRYSLVKISYTHIFVWTNLPTLQLSISFLAYKMNISILLEMCFWKHKDHE